MNDKEKYANNDKNTHRVFVRNKITQFKDRLRQAMGSESGNSLAKRCGISEAAIRTYLSGKTYPSLDKLALLAEKCEVSIEWLANGSNVDSAPEVPEVKEVPKHVTETQEKVWLEFLHRMTPDERDAVIARVVRLGLGVILQPSSTDNKQEQSSEDALEKLDVSGHALLVARMYDSLTDEQRQRFLESIRGEEQKETDRHLSGKSKAS
ncbi:helix-turn-helix domain-containing protein [Xenorhabdus sp. XENO-7]|uniref:Helix-turn-helix domain-containing protein n=1 Tax=Xenorhabdus aichiensis TaxID=3025874 RepID=A0ABT5LXH8_9GAMM|nr:helix-turn-helix domain-containing protein [Xenorhabdus aichiensis]MDC9620104.1 helix-turn-helix domain-containing protein [Xenorhabdus aichiensis]